MIVSLEGECRREGDSVVAKWPQLPDYRGGNLIAYESKPTSASMTAWERHFAHEFAVSRPHFAWSIALHGLGDAESLESFDLERTSFLEMTDFDFKPSTDFEVRPLMGDLEWDEALTTQIHAVPEAERDPEIVDFFASRMRRYRVLADAKQGQWWGAFSEKELVGSCGIFAKGNKARFQSVVTKTSSRKQGVATHLVAQVCGAALTTVESLTIAASRASSAERIYKRIGFREVDEMGSLLKKA